jgi:RNA polymerase sigma-70 factor (ECF subfamily)
MTDDKALIGRLKRGDQAALECIYVKYRPQLMATACSYHVDRHVAEDILHDVFLSFTKRITEFEINHSLYGYLRAGILNGIRDMIRRRSRQETGMIRNALSDEIIHSPHECSVQSEEVNLAEKLLHTLSEPQREVVRLRIRQGLKFKDIARVQGVSSSTARGRYRYGISHMRGSVIRHLG